MVTLNNKNEKNKVLSNLGTLKGLEKYHRVSVTEDLTAEERKKLKELSLEAKERNLSENSSIYVWRVRGRSRTGFLLKKSLKPKNLNVHKSDS